MTLSTLLVADAVLPLLLFALPVGAEKAFADWQSQQLLNPSKAQIAREVRGYITIYDGLTEAKINRAMDQQFDSIENMMFIRVVKSDDQGRPTLNPETGEAMVEDDGC